MALSLTGCKHAGENLRMCFPKEKLHTFFLASQGDIRNVRAAVYAGDQQILAMENRSLWLEY